MSRLTSVLFWSVISAAFIGPGTVTAAASAGAGYGLSLLWALVFSTIACLVLQEASARLTVASGLNLGQALRRRDRTGLPRTAMMLLILGAIVVGCAAYEAGNILGGVAGAALALPFSGKTLTLTTVGIAAVLLWFNSPRRIALLLSALVAVMGGAFLWTALRLGPPISSLLNGAVRFSLPEGSSLLAIALVGTTVVPYNLFLGSGLARGQELGEIRFGLGVAVVLGGLISMAVLVVGTATALPLEFSELSAVLAARLGGWSRILFALGLFAAGLSSAVTAPLAAAVTARSVFGSRVAEADEAESPLWGDSSFRFRAVWVGVLAVGLAFGVSGVQPVPVIILAQALNGILLPVVAIFLLVAVNDRHLMGERVNRSLSNIVMGVVVLICLFLGLSNVGRALSRALGLGSLGASDLIWLAAILLALIGVAVLRAVWRRAPVAKH